MTVSKVRTQDEVEAGQLRLALMELARIENEIRAVKARPRSPEGSEPLRSLYACKTALLRMVVQRPVHTLGLVADMRYSAN